MSFIRSFVEWLTPRRPPAAPQRLEFDEPEQHVVPVQRPAAAAANHQKEPAKFNGKSDLADYLTHFEAVSQWNRWNYEQQGLQLAISLVEDAREILQNIHEEERYDYNTLVEALKRRFTPLGEDGHFSLELMDRKCGKHESVTVFGHKLRRLASKAYGRFADDQVLVDLYIRGLPSAEMQRDVYLKKPNTLEEAMVHAANLEFFEKKKISQRPVYAISEQTPEKKENTQIIQALGMLTDQISKISMSGPEQQRPAQQNPQQVVGNYGRNYNYGGNDGQSGGRKKARDMNQVQCFKCGEFGHFANSCPAKGTFKGPCYFCGDRGHHAASCPNAGPTMNGPPGQISHPGSN